MVVITKVSSLGDHFLFKKVLISVDLLIGLNLMNLLIVLVKEVNTGEEQVYSLDHGNDDLVTFMCSFTL